MFEIVTIIAVILAIAIAVVLILAATKPNTLQRAARHHHQGAGGKDISADQRLSSMGLLVAL